MGEASDTLKKALRGERGEATPSEGSERSQPNVSGVGEGAGGPEQASSATAAGAEVD